MCVYMCCCCLMFSDCTESPEKEIDELKLVSFRAIPNNSEEGLNGGVIPGR